MKKRITVTTTISKEGESLVRVEGMKGKGCLGLTKNLVASLSTNEEDVEIKECDGNGGFSTHYAESSHIVEESK